MAWNIVACRWWLFRLPLSYHSNLSNVNIVCTRHDLLLSKVQNKGVHFICIVGVKTRKIKYVEFDGFGGGGGGSNGK